MRILKDLSEFQWDSGNINKNLLKHQISNKESEETFFDNNKIVYKDVFHSQKESRFILIGQSKNGRLIYVIYTIRDSKIRIISARDVNKNERRFYEKKTDIT